MQPPEPASSKQSPAAFQLPVQLTGAPAQGTPLQGRTAAATLPVLAVSNTEQIDQSMGDHVVKNLSRKDFLLKHLENQSEEIQVDFLINFFFHNPTTDQLHTRSIFQKVKDMFSLDLRIDFEFNHWESFRKAVLQSISERSFLKIDENTFADRIEAFLRKDPQLRYDNEMFSELLFQVLYKGRGYPIRIHALILKIAETHLNCANFINPLFDMIRSGEYNQNLQGDEGVCTWIENFVARFDEPPKLTGYGPCRLSPTVALLLLNRMPADVKGHLVSFYLEILGLVYQHHNPQHLAWRDQLITPLLLEKPLAAVWWLQARVPPQDPLHTIAFKAIPNSQLIPMLCTNPNNAQKELLVERLVALREKACQLEGWSTEKLVILLQILANQNHGYLYPHEREAVIAWINHETPAQHLWVFGFLLGFIDFPSFWPHFRIPANIEKKQFTKFLYNVATEFPELTLQTSQKRAYPHTYLDLRYHIGHALYHHHFPERMNCPEIPPNPSSVHVKRWVIEYCILSSETARNTFKEQLGTNLAQLLDLISQPLAEEDSDSDQEFSPQNEFVVALLFLKSLVKVVQHNSPISYGHAPQFNQFIQIVCARLDTQNDPKVTYMFLEQIDLLIATLPDFFTVDEIDLTPVKELRAKWNSQFGTKKL